MNIESSKPYRMLHSMARRTFLIGAGGAVAAGLAGRRLIPGREAGLRAQVFIAKADSYTANLVATIGDALVAIGWGPAQVRRKRVLLKPNLVEPSREAPEVNTHPAVVRAAAEVFLRWDAREVVVAEGQGHCRDAELVLDQSGLTPVLREAGLRFVDLNHDDVYAVANRHGLSKLPTLYFPRTLKRADLVVSLPKLKTHHWAGVTLAMKNLFGLMPGICYGWPKNVFHKAGIDESILDINHAIQPQLAIVDGIVGMEGDGPIMGTPRWSRLLVLGRNLTAVDATATRLMDLDPARIPYLAAASGHLGPIAESHIEQLGESIADLRQHYRLLDHPSLAWLRA